ncbi:MAG: VCBS repeat-containing protein [Sediminibacterium sp.]|nr:VCBS repeat-containing protein [Sediminibacterium sp.]
MNANNEEANPIVFEYNITSNGFSFDTSLILPDEITYSINPVEKSENKYSDIFKGLVNCTGDFDGDGNLDFIANGKSYYNIFYQATVGNIGRTGRGGYMLPLLPKHNLNAINTLNNVNKLKQSQDIAFDTFRNSDNSILIDIYTFYSSNNMFLDYSKSFKIPNKKSRKIYISYQTANYTVSNQLLNGYMSGRIFMDHQQIWYLITSNGNIRLSAPPIFDSVLETKTYFSDFNGDGLTDALIFVPSYIQYDYYEYYDNYGLQIGTISTNIAAKYYLADLNRFNNNSLTEITTIGSLTDNPDNTKLFFNDFDGDGKTDLLRIDTISNNYTLHTLNINNNSNTYNFTQLFAETLPSKFDINGISFGDINGDQKMDFLLPSQKFGNIWHIYISSGKSFKRFTQNLSFCYNESSITLDKDNYFSTGVNYFIDLNNDSKSDFVHVEHYRNLLHIWYFENNSSDLNINFTLINNPIYNNLFSSGICFNGISYAVSNIEMSYSGPPPGFFIFSPLKKNGNPTLCFLLNSTIRRFAFNKNIRSDSRLIKVSELNFNKQTFMRVLIKR